MKKTILSKGRVKIEFVSHYMDEGRCIVVTGGKSHIGATAISIPRPSLSGDGSVSASTSVVTVPGHKDDRIAVSMAETLAKSLHITISVTCGIHIDNITKEEISYVDDLVKEYMDKMIQEQLKSFTFYQVGVFDDLPTKIIVNYDKEMTVRDLFEWIEEKYSMKLLNGLIIDDHLNSEFMIVIDGRTIRHSEVLETVIPEGSEILLSVILAGG